jgi:DNA (cytosine-5)-methyltransferase 1
MHVRIEPETASAADFRRLREVLGYSRADLARKLGFTAASVSRWESGKTRDLASHFGNLQELMPEKRVPHPFRFIDLFAGIGGFRIGFESVGGTCVFTSEWDEHAQSAYRRNHGHHDIHGDITQVNTREIPDHDVLLAGFPCQPFSLAGVSKKNSLGRKHGFECETQGTLFFDIERIIRAKEPKAFVLENVKNLKSHDGGNTFRVIQRTLEERLDYRISYRVIDGRSFVPQHRERIFIVGLRRDVEARFDFADVALRRGEDGPRLSSILHPEDGTEHPEERFMDGDGRVLPKYTLTPALWQYLQEYAQKHRAAGNGFGFGLVGPDDVARTLSARYYKDGAEILVRKRRGPPRRLTPRECARLMGFDRPGYRPFEIPVSDTQAYRLFGNSVVVPLIEAIASALVPYLRGERRGSGLDPQHELELAGRVTG